MGFPTANLTHFHSQLSGITKGVYCGWCLVENDPDSIIRCCVTNIGLSPTFAGAENAQIIMESFVLDRPSNLPDFYNKPMRLLLVDFLRPEKKFTGPDALIQQINEDVVWARERTQYTEDAKPAKESIESQRTANVDRKYSVGEVQRLLGMVMSNSTEPKILFL